MNHSALQIPTVAEVEVVVPTKDGQCRAHIFSASVGERLPAIIFYMDAGGIRPAVIGMARRLAAAGFVVMLPDLFYRFGPYGPLVPSEVFKGDAIAILGPLMATTDNRRAANDTEAFLTYLDTRNDAAADKVGAVGFCMGGGMALSAAAKYPSRFRAVASFHGSNLASDSADSPHHSVASLKAEVYIAAAENDDFYPAAMAAKFETALRDANVKYSSETYDGTHHGWMKPDFPVFDNAASERGWEAMIDFFKRTLG
jgi:carboxymethylenebutenolidase